MARNKSKKSKKMLVLRESLGECLHVALRKACDSHPTTLAYVMVKLMPRTIWDEWLSVMWDGLSKLKAPTRELVTDSLKAHALHTYDPGSYYVGERDMDNRKPGAQRLFINKLPPEETAHRTNEQILIDRDRWRHLWRGILELFTDHDWGCFAAYLLDESGEP